MTQTLAHALETEHAVRLGRSRRALRAVAVVSCVPYLSLKAAWIAGSRIGIPDGSSLLEHRATMAVANSVTVLMDAAVIVLALVLTRPWGLRAPAWLLGLPAWVATGLLAPIMAGFPLQVLVDVLGGSTSTAAAEGEPFLDAWVFGVVYTGFIVQGLTLGALFVDGPTPLLNLTYAGQMIVGILVACLGVHFLAERDASRTRRTA